MNSITQPTQPAQPITLPPKIITTMTKDSQVGSASIYEAGDQRTTSNKEERQHKSEQRFEEGNKNAHKDERSIKNRLAAASAEASTSDGPERSSDPRDAAISHGNEPSRGAKIDAELKADDEAMLAKKQGK